MAFDGDLVQPVGDRLGRVVLPELHPGMGAIPERVELAERRTVRCHRQDGAGGEVDADADDVLGADLARRERLGDPAVEDLQVVGGVLERRVRGQLPFGRRQPRVDDAVRVAHLGDRDLLAGAQVEDEHTARHCAEIDTDRQAPAGRRRAAHAGPADPRRRGAAAARSGAVSTPGTLAVISQTSP